MARVHTGWVDFGSLLVYCDNIFHGTKGMINHNETGAFQRSGPGWQVMFDENIELADLKAAQDELLERGIGTRLFWEKPNIEGIPKTVPGLELIPKPKDDAADRLHDRRVYRRNRHPRKLEEIRRRFTAADLYRWRRANPRLLRGGRIRHAKAARPSPFVDTAPAAGLLPPAPYPLSMRALVSSAHRVRSRISTVACRAESSG